MASSTKKAPEAPVVNLHEAEKRKKALVETYRAEAKVSKSISPLYQPYFGKCLQISINGITIAMPVDGSTHDVPQSFADEIQSRIMAIDNTIKKASKMSNVASNSEQYPGELKMF